MERPPLEISQRRYEFYVCKVEEAEANARRATDPLVRQTWIDVADSWRHLAEHMKRILGGAD